MAPRAASDSAVARPIPLEAPVTITTWPRSSEPAAVFIGFPSRAVVRVRAAWQPDGGDASVK